MSLGTVNSLTGASQAYTPLLLVAFTFQSSTVPPLLLATRPILSFPGIGNLPAGNYDGRIAQQDIPAFQHRSNLGVDRPAEITFHIFDADHFIWSNICLGCGFRGATVIVCLVMWQPGTSNFSSDAPQKFIGTCDMEMPTQGGNIITVKANNSHNMATVKLPMFPIQSRCARYFPSNAAERALALAGVGQQAEWCPYSHDQPGGYGNAGPTNHTNAFGDVVTDGSGNYIACDFLRSDPSRADTTVGCMARLGNYSATGVAPDGDVMHDQSGKHTGSLTNLQWSPGTYYAYAKNYISGQSLAVFSFLNSAILGTFQNLLYGSQFVNAKIANVVESGNGTTCTAMICSGDIGQNGIFLVLANGISIARAPSGDSVLWWDFPNNAAGGGTFSDTGGRFGIAMYGLAGMSNSSYKALADPLGSTAKIIVTMYKDIFTGFGTPTIQVLCAGPSLYVYVPIATASGSGSFISLTLDNNLPSVDCAVGVILVVYGCSWGAINGIPLVVTGNTQGPPGVIVVASSISGSGTGGVAQYKGGIDQTVGIDVKSNPAWVVMDILAKANWSPQLEINVSTFALTARYAWQVINYITSSGTVSSHVRFNCQFSLESRRSAAAVLTAVLRSFNGYLYIDTNGLLSLGIATTMADSQSTPVPGSNYNTPVSSIGANGTSASGYAAFLIDQSCITAVENAQDVRFDIEGEGNATIQTPNQIYISFQDQDNQYDVDSYGEYDTSAIARAGGALQPGGSIIPETLDVLGLTNFDQCARISNVFIAERQYGNENNDPRGTRSFVIGVTIKTSSLRVGHIILFTYAPLGYNKQKFRITKIQVGTDYSKSYLTIQFHNDIWYTDEYGQSPQQFQGNAGTQKPKRAPLPWQPQLQAGQFIQYPNDHTFGVSEENLVLTDGSVQTAVLIQGIQPINQLQSSIYPPLVPLQATTGSTGGTIPGGFKVTMQLCGYDAAGNVSAPSKFITVVIPSGTNTNTVTISDIQWYPGTVNYDVFAGLDHFGITKVVGFGSGSPSPLTITTMAGFTAAGIGLSYAPPDVVASTMVAQAKQIFHAGLLGETVIAVTSGPNTVTIGPPATGTFSNVITGYPLVAIGNINTGSGGDFSVQVSSYVVNGDRSITFSFGGFNFFNVGDVVVLGALAGNNGPTSIGDPNNVTVYYPGGAFTSADVGRTVRIIAGKGRYQTRQIISYASNTFEVDSPWHTQPDSTSQFIVESTSFAYRSPPSPFSATTFVNMEKLILVVANSTGMVLLVQVLMGDSTGTLFSSQYRSPFRMMYITGQGGTNGPSAYTITPSLSGIATIDLANGTTQELILTGTTINGAIASGVSSLTVNTTVLDNTACPFTFTWGDGAGELGNTVNVVTGMVWTLASPTTVAHADVAIINTPVSLSIPTNGGVALAVGQPYTLELVQDATGGRLLPTFPGGAGGFVSDTQNRIYSTPIQYNPTLSTMTSLSMKVNSGGYSYIVNGSSGGSLS